MSDLVAQGLAIQRAGRPRYQQKAFVEVTLDVAGNTWEGEAEVIYDHIPAFSGRFDEPGYGEHIELTKCYAMVNGKKVDITELCNDGIVKAIQLEIIGE